MKNRAMKKVEATINRSELDAVQGALVALGLDAVSVCEVEAYYPLARRSRHPDGGCCVWLSPQMRIGVVVDDDRLAPCVTAICRCAGADAAGHSAIVVLPIEGASQQQAAQCPARAA
jgi:nitrogen regulatory protein PII